MFSFFFFNDTATTEIYTLSLHDALPISKRFPYSDLSVTAHRLRKRQVANVRAGDEQNEPHSRDRKSTRLNSSHGYISYAVFCLKKKNKNKAPSTTSPM